MSYKTIKLKQYTGIINEYPAGAAILPGSLLTINSDDEVIVQATAGVPGPVLIALEDELQGNTTRDEYAADDKVQVWAPQPGEEVLGLVDSDFDPAIGDLLQASTGGELEAYDDGTAGVDGTTATLLPGYALFQVIGAKITDDADTANHRIPVRRI